jgi:phenylacetate-CoA ligase
VLWRRATPLIRYALGDLGEWAQGPCPCGSPFPLLESLRGREQEMVTLPDGAEVTGTALRICLSDAPSIRQYQMVQETPDSFFLRVVPGPDFTDETARAIVRAFQEQFRGQVRLRVIRVGTIPRSPEIKFTSLVTLRQIERMRRAGRDVRLMVSADP